MKGGRLADPESFRAQLVADVAELEAAVATGKEEIASAKEKQKQAKEDIKRLEKDMADFKRNKDSKLNELKVRLPVRLGPLPRA